MWQTVLRMMQRFLLPLFLFLPLSVLTRHQVKSKGLYAVLCGSGSGRIGIIVPDPHPADPDPRPNAELNYMFFRNTCVDPETGKIWGICAMFSGSGSGRIGIIVPDPHPADPDPQPNAELNYMFFRNTCVDSEKVKSEVFVQCFLDRHHCAGSASCRSGSISIKCRAKLYFFF